MRRLPSVLLALLLACDLAACGAVEQRLRARALVPSRVKARVSAMVGDFAWLDTIAGAAGDGADAGAPPDSSPPPGATAGPRDFRLRVASRSADVPAEGPEVAASSGSLVVCDYFLRFHAAPDARGGVDIRVLAVDVRLYPPRAPWAAKIGEMLAGFELKGLADPAGRIRVVPVEPAVAEVDYLAAELLATLQRLLNPPPDTAATTVDDVPGLPEGAPARFQLTTRWAPPDAATGARLGARTLSLDASFDRGRRAVQVTATGAGWVRLWRDPHTGFVSQAREAVRLTTRSTETATRASLQRAIEWFAELRPLPPHLPLVESDAG